jgi:hypothetical protein
MMQLLFKRPDGTFVADLGRGPYHVIPDDAVAPAGLWNRAVAEAARLGDDLPFEPVPPAPTPEETLAAWRATAKVSRFQAFAALSAAGKLTDATAAVNAAGGLAKLAWDNAIEFRRDSPTIASLAAAVGLDDAALDALFIAAAEIEA